MGTDLATGGLAVVSSLPCPMQPLPEEHQPPQNELAAPVTIPSPTILKKDFPVLSHEGDEDVVYIGGTRAGLDVLVAQHEVQLQIREKDPMSADIRLNSLKGAGCKDLSKEIHKHLFGGKKSFLAMAASGLTSEGHSIAFTGEDQRCQFPVKKGGQLWKLLLASLVKHNAFDPQKEDCLKMNVLYGGTSSQFLHSDFVCKRSVGFSTLEEHNDNWCPGVYGWNVAEETFLVAYNTIYPISPSSIILRLAPWPAGPVLLYVRESDFTLADNGESCHLAVASVATIGRPGKENWKVLASKVDPSPGDKYSCLDSESRQFLLINIGNGAKFAGDFMHAGGVYLPESEMTILLDEVRDCKKSTGM